jgi:hypothetical protein
MKLTLRQTLASTAGATLAAILASFFGVKGTIIGVAIGSAAATIGTALVARSIERGHDVVKQVVGTPEDPGVFRRLGDTGIVGSVRQDNVETGVIESVSPSDSVSPREEAPTEVLSSVVSGDGGPDDTVTMPTQAGEHGAKATEPVPVAGATRPTHDALDEVGIEAKAGGGYKIDWPVLAGAIGIVFVLTMICIVVIALVTSYVTGNSVANFISPGSTANTTTTVPPSTTTSTSTTTTAPTTTTTTTSESTTTTTVGTTTTTVSPNPTTTTAANSATTTTSPS